jgi:N-acetylmuramoyl-L-alanine amidase
MVKIFVDPGHGGSDSGAVGNGLQEKDVTLEIAKKMEEILKGYQNVEVKLSRADDQSVSLQQRTDMANSWGADVLLSIHLNSSSSSDARGFESYIYPNAGSRTTQLQDILHAEIWEKIDNYTDDNRGKRQANFHMLRESNMEACLTENLFISNKQDAELLKDENFIYALATGHVDGCVRFFGLKKK